MSNFAEINSRKESVESCNEQLIGSFSVCHSKMVGCFLSNLRGLLQELGLLVSNQSKRKKKEKFNTATNLLTKCNNAATDPLTEESRRNDFVKFHNFYKCQQFK